MRFTDPGPETLWVFVAPAAVVVGVWIALTLAEVRQRAFWVVAGLGWVTLAGATLVRVYGEDTIYQGMAVLVAWSIAMLALFPVSVIVSDRRSRRT